MSKLSFLQSVLVEIASTAAQCAAYKWSDDFCRKELREVWTDSGAALRKQRIERVTVADLRDISLADLLAIGFRKWDGRLILIPLWALNYIAAGEELISISENTALSGSENVDTDVRAVCIAYGFYAAA